MGDIGELLGCLWLAMAAIFPITPVRGPREEKPVGKRAKLPHNLVRPLVWAGLVAGSAVGCMLGPVWLRFFICAPLLAILIAAMAWLPASWLWSGSAELSTAAGEEKKHSVKAHRFLDDEAGFVILMVLLIITFASGWVLPTPWLIAASVAGLVALGTTYALTEVWTDAG